MRLILLAIGLLFIAAGCFAPIEGRQWTSYEPVGVPLKVRPSEAKTVLVYHDSRMERIVMKYAAFVMGGALVYVSIRKPAPADYKKLRKWVRKRKRLRRKC